MRKKNLLIVISSSGTVVNNENNKPNNKRNLDQIDNPTLEVSQPKRQKLISLKKTDNNGSRCHICLAKSKELNSLFRQFTWDSIHLKPFPTLLYETKHKYQIFFINSRESALKALTFTVRLFSTQFKCPILLFTHNTAVTTLDCFYKKLNYKSYYSLSNSEEFNQFLIDFKNAMDGNLGIHILLGEQDVVNSDTTLSNSNLELFSKLLINLATMNYDFNNIKWAIQKTITGPYNLLSSNEKYVNWGILTWLLQEWLSLPKIGFIDILFGNLGSIFPKIRKIYVPIIWYMVESNVETIYFIMPKKTLKPANTFSNFVEILYKKQSFRAINKNTIYEPNHDCYRIVSHILSKYTTSHTQQTNTNFSDHNDSIDYDSKNAEIDKHGTNEISYEKLEDYFELIENQFTSSISAITCNRYVEYGFCVNVVKEITMKIHKYCQLGDSTEPIEDNYNKFIICGDNSNFFASSNDPEEHTCWWIPKNMSPFFFGDNSSLSLAMILILKMIKVSDFLLGIMLYGQSKETLRNNFLELAFSKLRSECVWVYNYSNFLLKTTRDDWRYYISNTDTKLLNKIGQDKMPEKTILLENSKGYLISPSFVPEIIPTMLTDFITVLNIYIGATLDISEPTRTANIYVGLLKTSLEIYGVRELQFKGQIQNKKISNNFDRPFVPRWKLTNKRLYYESYNRIANEWRFYNGISDNGAACTSPYTDEDEFILLKYDLNTGVEKYKITDSTTTTTLLSTPPTASDHVMLENLPKITMLDNFFNQWISEETDKKLVNEILSLTFCIGFVLKDEFQKSTGGRRDDIHSISLDDRQYLDYYYVSYDSKNKDRTMFTPSGHTTHYNEKMTINNERVDITIENTAVKKIYNWIHPIPGKYDTSLTRQDAPKKKLLEKTCCPSFNMQLFGKLIYKKIKSQKYCNLISTMLNVLSDLGNEEYYNTILDELEAIYNMNNDKIEESECYSKLQYQFYSKLEKKVREYTLEKKNKKNLIYSNSSDTKINEKSSVGKFILKIFPNIPTTIVNTIYIHDFKEGGLCESENRQLLFVFGKNTISNMLDEFFVPNGLTFIRDYSTRRITENPSLDGLKTTKSSNLNFNTMFYVLTFDFNATLRSAHNFRLIVTKESGFSTKTDNDTCLEVITIPITERIFNKLLSNAYITLTQENW